MGGLRRANAGYARLTLMYAKRQADVLRFSTGTPLLLVQSENFTQCSNVFCYFCGFFRFFRRIDGKSMRNSPASVKSNFCQEQF